MRENIVAKKLHNDSSQFLRLSHAITAEHAYIYLIIEICVKKNVCEQRQLIHFNRILHHLYIVSSVVALTHFHSDGKFSLHITHQLSILNNSERSIVIDLIH